MKIKILCRIAFCLSVVALLSSCDSGSKRPAPAVMTDTPSDNVIRVGGLYTYYYDSSYIVSKVLASDEFAIHLRTYSNKFAAKPTDLSSDTLGILIGHAPLDPKGFLSDHPQLIKIEPVKESELEGYKLYLDAMKKQ